MKKVIIVIAITVLTLLSVGMQKTQAKTEKMDICHATFSKGWMEIEYVTKTLPVKVAERYLEKYPLDFEGSCEAECIVHDWSCEECQIMPKYWNGDECELVKVDYCEINFGCRLMCHDLWCGWECPLCE